MIPFLFFPYFICFAKMLALLAVQSIMTNNKRAYWKEVDRWMFLPTMNSYSFLFLLWWLVDHAGSSWWS
jgi:hypothetical protein